MNIRLTVFTLLCVLYTIGFLSCASDTSSESSSAKSPTASSLATGWYAVVDEGTKGAVEKQLDREKGIYYLDPQPLLTSEHIKDAFFYTGFGNDKGVQMELTKKGIDLWAAATEQYLRKSIAFVFDDLLITVQRVAAKDSNGATIFYKKAYSEEELQMMIDKMKAN